MTPEVSRIIGWRGVGLWLDGDVDLCAELTAHLPSFFNTERHGLGVARLELDGDWVHLHLPDDLSYSGPRSPETMRAAASRFELSVVSRLSDVVVVHAGAAALGDQIVLLPGRSRAGKSTLVQALLDDGFEYLSDEYALVTPDGTVAAYPRRLTRRGASGTFRTAPGTSRAVDHPPGRVSVVLFLTYSAEAEPIEAISPAHCVLRLMENAVNGRRDPERVVQGLSAVAQAACSFAGTRGEAGEAARMIRHLLEN